jgi:hypothetical protein
MATICCSPPGPSGRRASITLVDEQGALVGILTTTNALEALIWFAHHVRDAA